MPSHPIHRLTEGACGLLVIDLQEKFAPVIKDWNSVLAASIRLVRFFHLLRAPIVVTEQYPKGLGVTVPELREALSAQAWAPVVKTSFSCCGTAELRSVLEAKGSRQWLLCGIEAHVCVQQTAFDLLEQGCEVFLAADAIGSQRPSDRETALSRMARDGVHLSTSESLIFEIMRDAKHPLFKSASALVKG